jgi:hypothetical protein
MSRVRVRIDQVAVRGLDSVAADAVIDALRLELARVLVKSTALPTRSQRTPVVKLGPIPLQVGSSSARNLGQSTAHAIARTVHASRARQSGGPVGGSG